MTPAHRGLPALVPSPHGRRYRCATPTGWHGGRRRRAVALAESALHRAALQSGWRRAQRLGIDRGCRAHYPLFVRCGAALQEFAAKMCPLGGKAAPMLLKALDAGGKQAQLAVAALKTYGACIDDQARKDAMASLIDSPQLNNRTLVIK